MAKGRLCSGCGQLRPAAELKRRAVCFQCRPPDIQRKSSKVTDKPQPTEVNKALRYCPVCGRHKPPSAFSKPQFGTSNRWCDDCRGREVSRINRSGSKIKRRSVWAVSGGLPTLGKRRK